MVVKRESWTIGIGSVGDPYLDEMKFLLTYFEAEVDLLWQSIDAESLQLWHCRALLLASG
jgi:hypothetical protein